MNNDASQHQGHDASDSKADAIAATVLIAVAILAAVMWISGH